MKSLAKFVGFLTTALMLAAFSLPASAAKTIGLDVTPLLAQPTQVVTATIKNTGNSNANSFGIDWMPPSGSGFTVSLVSVTNALGVVVSTDPSACSGAGCRFNYQLPTKQFVKINLRVQITDPCAPLPIDWYAYAWTGAPGDKSQAFAQDAPVPFRTASSPNCTIKFVTQPTDAFIGKTITGSRFNSTSDNYVSVQLQNGTVAAPSGVVVTASSSACSIAGSATTETDASGMTYAYFKTLKSTAGGTVTGCVLTASATGYASATSGPPAFKVVAGDGPLACPGGSNTTITAGVPGSSAVVGGVRNSNVDGSACTPIPYNLTSSCDTTNPANGCKTVFEYDPLGQGASMSFTFHTEWPLEPVPPLPAPGVAQVKATLQFFQNGSSLGVELNFCPGIVVNPDGTVTGTPPDLDSPLGIQAGCLINRQVKQVGDKIQVIEDTYVQGDYTATRSK